jgi:hypothetical protein
MDLLTEDQEIKNRPNSKKSQSDYKKYTNGNHTSNIFMLDLFVSKLKFNICMC